MIDSDTIKSLSPNKPVSVQTVARLASLIDERGDAAIAAVKLSGIQWLDGAEMMLIESYRGAYCSFDEYATKRFWKLYGTNIPVAVRCYVDTKAYGHDLQISGAFMTEEVNGLIHVFECR